MVTNFESYNVAAIAAEWQDWGHWSQCTASCGQGLKIRARGCSEPEFGGDLLCSGNGTEVEGCNSAECPGELTDADAVTLSSNTRSYTRRSILTQNIE